jgi:hypothetical protein
MQSYTISQGRHLIAYVTVDDAGQLTWDFSPNAWEGSWMSIETKTAIESAITALPMPALVVVQSFTIRPSTP